MAIVTATGGPPSLATIASLVRVVLNDWQAGLNNVPGEGRITTNDATLSPQTLPALNSAIRWVYRKLRNVGDPRLIRDNVQVSLPANAATGPGIQTYLAYNGYYDGVTLQVTPVLPADMMYPLYLSEQQTSSAGTLAFVPMSQPAGGLPSRMQQTNLVDWEWREQPSTIPGNSVAPAAIFFVGSISTVTVRMRYMAALTRFVSLTSADYATAYVPIIDCEEAVAYRTAYIISAALSGMTPGVQALKAEAEDAVQDLRNSVIRRQQTQENARQPYSTNTWGGAQYSVNGLI